MLSSLSLENLCEKGVGSCSENLAAQIICIIFYIPPVSFSL